MLVALIRINLYFIYNVWRADCFITFNFFMVQLNMIIIMG